MTQRKTRITPRAVDMQAKFLQKVWDEAYAKGKVDGQAASDYVHHTTISKLKIRINQLSKGAYVQELEAQIRQMQRHIQVSSRRGR